VDALTPCSCDGMTDSSDSSSELDLAADFVAALLLDDDSDDGDRGSAGACGATAGGADRAISEPASHKYRDAHRAFHFEGLPSGLQLEQRYLEVSETGGAVYDAGVVLSRWLSSHPTAVCSLPVLELGCGPGLTALTAAALGASEVIATDMDESALKLARDNIEAHTEWLTQCPFHVCKPELLRYRWGTALPPKLRSWRDRAAGCAGGGVVLAADVLYDNVDSFAALLSTLSSLLLQSPAGSADDRSAPVAVRGGSTKDLMGSTCLLCFPRRRIDAEHAYVDALHTRFSVERLDVSGCASGCDREMVLLRVQPLPNSRLGSE